MEFRFGARFLRDLVSAYRVVRGDVAADDVDWQTLPEDDQPHGVRRGISSAANLISIALSAALRPYSPQVFAAPVPVVGMRPTAEGMAYVRACAELYNHIVEGATYRVCERWVLKVAADLDVIANALEIPPSKPPD